MILAHPAQPIRLGDPDSDEDSYANQFTVMGAPDSDDDSSKPIDFTPAARFVPPAGGTPQNLFSIGNTRHVGNTGGRFVRLSNQRQFLIYTDGACLNNGQNNAVGGYAFVFKSGRSSEIIKAGVESFRLEDCGPSGVAYPHTSNRAELRAVIAVLQYRRWNGEGHNQIVIATDSEYVVLGATEWVTGWVKRGWRTSAGKEVKNRDLWEKLFRTMQKFKECHWRSLRVLFWRIPREWNTVADRAAKEAAATGQPCGSFSRISGFLC